MKPKFGLMRSRQFVMKDLYTFDADTESAKDTYEVVSEAYNNIFSKIGIDFVKGAKKVVSILKYLLWFSSFS